MNPHLTRRAVFLSLVVAAGLLWLLPLGTVPLAAAPVSGPPAPTNTCFVIGLYRDLLDRPPSSIELSNGLSFLTINGRQVYASSLLLANDYRAVLIQGYYQKFLGRPAKDIEVALGLAIFNGPGTAEQVVAAITDLDEYFNQARVGGDNAKLVRALYRDLLGRTATSGDITFGTNFLAIHPRQDYVTFLITSFAYKAALIRDWYQKYLGRPATDPEFNAAVSSLSGGARDEDVIAGMLGTTEYFNRAGLCGLYLPLVRR